MQVPQQCRLCNDRTETHEHLFPLCSFTQQARTKVMSSFEYDHVNSNLRLEVTRVAKIAKKKSLERTIVPVVHAPPQQIILHFLKNKHE